MPDQDSTPKDTQRSPTLLIVIIVIIVLGIATFLVLRPRGTDSNNHTNPAAPASAQH